MQWFAAVALLGYAVTATAADIDCAAFRFAHGRQARIQQELTLLQINGSILLKSNCPISSKPVTLEGYSEGSRRMRERDAS